jgi:hypothetical protein
MNLALFGAVDDALAAFPSMARPFRGSISMSEILGDPLISTFHHGAFLSETMDYSASLLKVAALYAGYELLNSARLLAETSASNGADELLAEMRANLSPRIEVAVPLIAASPGITSDMMVPKYDQVLLPILTSTGDTTFDFTPSFRTCSTCRRGHE